MLSKGCIYNNIIYSDILRDKLEDYSRDVGVVNITFGIIIVSGIFQAKSWIVGVRQLGKYYYLGQPWLPFSKNVKCLTEGMIGDKRSQFQNFLKFWDISNFNICTNLNIFNLSFALCI